MNAVTEPKIVINKAVTRPPLTQGGANNKGQAQTNGNNKFCTYCGKPRHTAETCYRKHGFPPGFKFRNQSNSVSVSQESTAVPSCPSNSNLQFTPEQYQKLLNLVQSNNPSQSHQTNTQSTKHSLNHVSSLISTSNTGNSFIATSISSHNAPWIIDTGATYFLFFLLSPIQVPNGSFVTTHISGIVQLTPHLILNDVFYIPLHLTSNTKQPSSLSA